MEQATSESTQGVIQTKRSFNIFGKKVVIIVVAIGLVTGSLFAGYYLYIRSLSLKAKEYRGSYINSIKGNNPKELQDFLVASLSEGVNDKYTKSAAYFITHRYFDNKGDIYEIYTYAKSDPVISFLNQAEAIYPTIFEKIRNNQLPKTFSEEGMYAFLAYLEVLHNNGFGDVAMLGTAAGQYAKMAYISKNWPANEGRTTEEARRNIEKSKLFLQGANQQVADILDGKEIVNDIYASDIVVGLNQYAYALRYLEYLGEPVTSTKSAREIFAFSKEFTKRNAPELAQFSHLADASSLMMVNGAAEEVRQALSFIMQVDIATVKPRDYSVLDRIIHAREGREAVGMYSDVNITALGNKVPEFKEWLKRGGWGEADFE